MIHRSSSPNQIISVVRIVSHAVLLLLLTSTTSAAQSQATATIRGRVQDQTGASLPGATVTITNTSTGAAREATTDTGGFYSVAALPVTGEYRVGIALAGFSPKEVDQLDLRAGEAATVNAALVASGGTSEVTVYGTAEGIRTDEPQLGVTLDVKEIEKTPILGRKLTSLPLLDAAVRPALNTGDLFLNNVLFVVDGSGRRQTAFMLDGSSADDAWGRQTVFTNLPLSSIQEFTVLSHAFSAEYGRTTGAAVNIVTKSGTNDIHGDALYVGRPAAMQADSPVSRVKTPDVLNQVSGSIGGPIVRDKTHYFVSAEYTHQRRDSFFTTPFEPPNATYGGHYAQTLVDARIDRGLAAGRTITLKTNTDAFTDDNPQGVVGGLALPSAGRTFTRRAYGAQASESRVIGSSFLNDVHAQLFYGSPITRFIPLQPSTQYVYSGVATLGESRAATLFSHQFEIADTLTLSRGRHDVRIGATAMHSRSGGDGQEFGGPFVLGQFTVKPGIIKPLSDLTVDDVQSVTQGFGSTTYEVTEWIWSIFAQDDVKLRSDLTVNLGARYERQTFTDDTDNVAPRVGATYNLAGDPRTVARAGYGMYYSEVRSDAAAAWMLNGPTGFFNFTAAPGQLGFPNTLGPLPAFPMGAVLPPRNITIRPGRSSYYSRFFDVAKLRGYPDALLNPWTQSASFGIEHDLGRKWLVSADYVKQHTDGIDRPLDLNAPAPFVRTAPGQVRTAAAADATRPLVPLPNGYRQIFAYVNKGIADYEGLQLSFRKLTERAAVRVSYAVSKTTNTVEPDVPSQAPNDASQTEETERAPSLLDQRHRVVLSGWSRLPSGVVIGGLMTAASGYRYNITTGSDNNGDGSNTDRPVVDGVVLSRNAGLGRPIYDTDLFIERAFAIGAAHDAASEPRAGGGGQMILRLEIFNVFNHANIAGYNGIFGNAPAGTPLTTLGMPLGGVTNVFPGRQMQLTARVRF